MPTPTISSFLPDVMCDPTELIWRQGTPFEVMTGRTAFIDCLQAEIFLSRKVNAGDLCTASSTISLSPLSLAEDVTDATFGASGLWLGTQTGSSGTITLV